MKENNHQLNQQSQVNQKKKLQQKKLQKNNKTLIAVALIFLIGIMLLINNNSSKLLDNLQNIVGNPLLQDQEIDNLEFKNAGISGNKLTVEVTNKNTTNYLLKTIDVKYIDREGNEITKVNGYIGNAIGKDETKRLVVSTDVDLSNAYKIEYIINK